LYHVANRNYCGDHKAEAWADRKKCIERADANGWPKHKFDATQRILSGIGRRLRAQRKVK
jgi:hypothetical protein